MGAECRRCVTPARLCPAQSCSLPFTSPQFPRSDVCGINEC